MPVAPVAAAAVALRPVAAAVSAVVPVAAVGGGRGGAAGAFGRPGGPARRGRKSKRQKRQEYMDNMQAPSVGGVRLPKGNGETIRLPRGASLTDFADKINANPASLVQVLFHLGEMVTATQSVSDEILELLGSEMNYDVQVVSAPRRRTASCSSPSTSPTARTPVARTTCRSVRRS